MLQEVKRPEAKMTVMITVLALAGISFLPIYTLFETQLQTGVNIFLERATEDSRTLQLEQFFANVPLTDLLIGTGPRGLWKMGNTYYGYVDGTYLFLLFVGGVPLLWGYLYLVVYPPIHCLIKKRLSLYGTIDFSCIIMGSIWGLVLTGFSTYTMPELKVNHYIILLCAGRCWFLLKRSPTQQ